MIADGVRDTELADYQRTVRTLLLHPLVTASSPDTSALGLVRRFSGPLAADLDSLAGYHLQLAPTCARLVRRVDRFDGTQGVRRRDRSAFDRRRYAYLCLVIAALGRAGSQVALTELADALKRRASEIERLSFDPDEYRHRLAFVDVVRHLLDLGALREVEVSTIDWVRDPDAGEALYDVDRDVLHLVVVPPRVLQHVRSAAALVGAPQTSQSREERRATTRRRLVRLLLEHPVVYLDDLDEVARTYLASQWRVVADDLHRLTGAQLERRAEGVALIDTTGGFSDRRFPTGGTAAQAALLLADAIAGAVTTGEVEEATVPLADEALAATVSRLDAARPPGSIHLTRDDADDRGEVGTDVGATADPPPADEAVPPRTVTGPLLTDGWLAARASDLIASHGPAFAADLRDDPRALAAAAVDVLRAFDLVRLVPGGVVARPAIARYREAVVHVAGPPPDQGSLFDTSTSEDAP